MEKWACLESCSEFFGFSIKDKYHTYRSCRRSLKQAHSVVLPGDGPSGSDRGKKSNSPRTHWAMGLGACQWLCRVRLLSTWGWRELQIFPEEGKESFSESSGHIALVRGIRTRAACPAHWESGWLLLCVVPVSEAVLFTHKLRVSYTIQLHQSPLRQPSDSWPQCRVIYAFQRREESGCWKQWGRKGRGRDWTSTAEVGILPEGERVCLWLCEEGQKNLNHKE